MQTKLRLKLLNRFGMIHHNFMHVHYCRYFEFHLQVTLMFEFKNLLGKFTSYIYLCNKMGKPLPILALNICYFNGS